MKPYIRLVITRDDGHRSGAEIAGEHVTPVMLEVAEDLLETLTTGERPPVKGLYELCAAAFGTTRDDAKERLVAAAYGKKCEPVGDLRTAVKKTDWSVPPLHDVSTKKQP